MKAFLVGTILFCCWWMLVGTTLKTITLDVGVLPVDYRTYAEAAARLETTGSPFQSASEAQGIWRKIHATNVAIFRSGTDIETQDVTSGPYLYPPSLAEVLSPGNASAHAYLLVQIIAVMVLCLVWFRTSGLSSSLWLVPLALSPDLLAAFMGGNVEVTLLCLALLACLAFHHSLPIMGGAFAGIVLLIKPQFAALFLAFGLLALMTHTPVRHKSLAIASLASLGVLAIAILRWPEALRAETFAYLLDPSERQFFALPPAEHWPMNIWNRAPLQVFLNAGVEYPVAQILSLGLYGTLQLSTCLILRQRVISFPVLFALAYVLFLIARPITWSMPLLGIIVVMAAWPHLESRGKLALGLTALVLALSHWIAFGLYAAGVSPGLLTLQTPTIPFETVMVFPGAWIILVLVARHRQAVA